MTKIQVEKIDTFSGHRDCVYALHPSGQRYQFFSAGGDGLVVRWDLTRPDWGEVVAQVPASVYALAHDPAHAHLWVGQNYEGIQIIAPDEKTVVASAQLTKAAIFDIQFSDNQAFVALSDGVVLVIDKAAFAVRQHLKASIQSARCIAVSPDGQVFAVGYSDHYIRIFDTQNLRLLHTIEAHSNSVFALCYSPDGRFLLSGSRDAHLKIWDVNAQYTLHQDVVAHLFAINHLVYSPDGQYIATCSMDKSIKLWDAATFRLLKVIDRARHAGHATSVNRLLWTDFEQRLISASDDKRLSVWGIY
ncbi:MAG: WD40 repeat domain-containing protein [Spirosomaceae bacterium]|nr:WD40 repeat domain-containing protein [Spirosomataceae bacterium]